MQNACYAKNQRCSAMLQTSNISRANHDNASVCIIRFPIELKTCASESSD
ncbi:hypothetical protein BIFBRE_03000 [Bifidobacterium breve DSM 20213 = JCM 1192]|uniref:Uncharacterized protein n=1 Tax=Bifidobacterium breve DSM 20213 = JCM 1192 TaxID=518634 RepID=D4BLR3_BIFBR|nr:hypothetical protein BIFBRE_03000 [Bifidobacterium breve DSM 20213 = JCM 1192]